MFGGGRKAAGLDVGSYQVKAVELRKAGSKLELLHLGVADVFPGGDRGAAGNSDPFELKLGAIQRAMQQSGIKTRHTVSAVSGESIIVRYIQLPDMPEAELKNALRWEAEEYIPFSIDEVNLDSVVLGPSSTQGKVDVLLVSARKDLVSEHVQLLRAADLIPIIVDVEGFAFLNCFDVNYQPSAEECVCLLNIGAEVSSINIYVGNTSRFSRDVGVAGNTLTQSVAQRCQIPFGKAEQLKVAVGAGDPMPDEDELGEDDALISTIRGTVERITGSALGDDSAEAAATKGVENALQQLIGEVRRSIQFFEGQSGGRTVQRVIAGGGTSRLRNLAPYFQAELDLPVEVFDPLRNITVSRDVDPGLLEQHREQLGTVIGLGLRKVLD